MGIKILYDVIKAKRNEIELSQQELSYQSGVNVNIIKALETGRANTTYENISKLSERLGLNIDDVYLEDFRDTKVIAVANNKGGSGKTSVCTSLGYTLSEIDDSKVLLIDSDMQMNLTHSYGIDRNEGKNLNIALRKEESLLGYIEKTSFDNIDIIISDLEMATMEMKLFTKPFREAIFKKILRPIIDKGIYDYIIIDTNPTLGILNLNILNASDFVIIPVEMTGFGLLGLDIILDFIKDTQDFNDNLKIAGIIRTKFDMRKNVTHKADELLDKTVGDMVLDTIISIDTNIEKSQWESDPLYPFKLKTKVAGEYRALAKEVMKIVK